MTHSIVLYRVVLNDDYAILAPYDERLKKIGIFDKHPAKVVEAIEREWGKKASIDDRSSMIVGYDWLMLNPSVVDIGVHPQALLRMGIIADAITIQMIRLFGVPKFMAAHCEGERAMEHWEKGRKPKLPKELQSLNDERK
jgi:hypothetical protein